MDHFQTNTTHVVIKFIEKSKNGKENIDLVPITWVYQQMGKWYSKYPKKNEYSKLDQMCKTSSSYGISWKGYEIIIIKEARK